VPAGDTKAPLDSPSIHAALERIVGSDNLRLDRDSLSRYGRDTCDMFSPAPSAVVFPGSAGEVRDIVLLANDKRLALVPSGGRTGLSGGATASDGEVVVCMERMNRVLETSTVDRTIRCQAGLTTGQLQQKALEMGLFYPVDFASAGSSHVGGNIATNAGGNRVIRYGMTRNWVAALEAVTGAGEVVQLGRGLLKDNTGYDLQQLFIGSEGTLGFVTEATMRLTSRQAGTAVAVLGLEKLENLLSVLGSFQNALAVNAFEFFTEEALIRVIERHGLTRPFDESVPVYALIELEIRSETDTQAVLDSYEICVEKGWVVQGTVSQSERQARDLWRLREDISETLSHWSPYKNDLSVRISTVPEFLGEVGELVAERYPGFEVLWYGHIGDGNVHLNILKPESMTVEEFKARCGEVSEEISQCVEKYHGSVSAEHGVGLLKKPFLHHSRTDAEIGLMRTIRRAFDPNGVMNPGKIFD
jgi:FAD/FMN-containing dehydrogenase